MNNVNYGNILATLQPNVKKLLRKYEHIAKKLIKAEFALRFNNQCINEKSLPIYTNIYIYIIIFKIGLSPQ